MGLPSVVASSLTRENFVNGIDPTGLSEGQTLEGTASSDLLTGTPFTDTLRGNGGGDRLAGNGGSDTLEGGAGNGMDTLTGVERLAFADSHLALDTGGVAGDVFRLYRAAFDRAPDLVGQGFWMEMLERGVSLHTVAASFLASEEFTRRTALHRATRRS